MEKANKYYAYYFGYHGWHTQSTEMGPVRDNDSMLATAYVVLRHSTIYFQKINLLRNYWKRGLNYITDTSPRDWGEQPISDDRLPEEDQYLLDEIAKPGQPDWIQIASALLEKSPVQIRLRFMQLKSAQNGIKPKALPLRIAQ
jgi:hypothetical protein